MKQPSEILAQSSNEKRTNVAIDADLHTEFVTIQSNLKKEFPTVREACRAAISDWNNKHRRRAAKAAMASLECPRSRPAVKHKHT